MSKKKIFIGIGIFWIAILGGFIAFKEFTMATGQEVLLKTVPVDPRDFFRGDYVVLRYGMSRVDLSRYPEAPVFSMNDVIYAEIKKDTDGHGEIVGFSNVAPAGKLFIKGAVRYVDEKNIRVEYGIESYFVPANKGYVLEQRMGDGVDAKVLIDKFGNGIIKSLLVDGKEVDFKNVKEDNNN